MYTDPQRVGKMPSKHLANSTDTLHNQDIGDGNGDGNDDGDDENDYEYYDPDNRPAMSSFADLRYERGPHAPTNGIIPREHLWYTEGKRVTGSTITAVSYLNDQINSGAYGSTVCNVTGTISYSFKTGSCNVPTGLTDSIKTCTGVLVAVPLVIEFRSGPGHLNMLIFDKVKSPMEVERFEPHGMMQAHATWGSSRDPQGINDSQTLLDQQLEKCIKTHLNVPFRYRPPSEICPRMGPQSKAAKVTGELGFCQTFGIMYADLRLRNPHLSAEEVTNSILSYSPEQLRDIVQSYSRKFDRESNVESEATMLYKTIKATADSARTAFPMTVQYLVDALDRQVKRNSMDAMAQIADDVSEVRYGLFNLLDKPYDREFDLKLLDAVDDGTLKQFVESVRRNNRFSQYPLISTYLRALGMDIARDQGSFAQALLHYSLYSLEMLLEDYQMLNAEIESTHAVKDVLDLVRANQSERLTHLLETTVSRRQIQLFSIKRLWAVPPLQQERTVVALKDCYLAKVQADTVTKDDEDAVRSVYEEAVTLGLLLSPAEKEAKLETVRMDYPHVSKYVKNLSRMPILMSFRGVLWLSNLDDLLKTYESLDATDEIRLLLKELQDNIKSPDQLEDLSQQWRTRNNSMYYLIKLFAIPDIMRKSRTLAEFKRRSLQKIQSDTWTQSDESALFDLLVWITSEEKKQTKP